jgi:competence protein ComEC
MKRPLLRVALPYVAGILAANYVRCPLTPLLVGAFGILITALCWTRPRPILLYPLLFLAGFTCYTFHTAALSPFDLRRILSETPRLITVRGELTETPVLTVYELDDKPSWRTLARIKVSSLCPDEGTWQAARGQIAVSTPAPLTNLFAGQTVEVFGVIAPPRGAVAEGTFDYRYYLRQQDIYFHLQAGSEQDWRVLSSPARPPLADRFRAWAQQALARGLPGEDESLRLEWALTLGWKPALTEEVSEPFVQAATYHIFAVDGLRMAIVFGIFFGLFRAVGVPRWLCGLILVPLIWSYVALTGWPASAIRATVMLSIIILGWALSRPSDLVNSLLAAALIILTWEPQQLFQAGFQLSFCVVLFLILLLPVLRRDVDKFTAPDPLLPRHLQRRWPDFLNRPARYTSDLLLTSFAAWIGSIPLVAYYFNIVTPVSTPANLVAVPLCGLVLIANLTSLLLAGWFPPAADLFNNAGWFLMECIRVSSHWFAAWPKAYFYTPAPSVVTSFLYYGLLLAFVSGWLWRQPWRLWKWAGVGTALLAWASMSWQGWSATRLTILPANGGTVIYVDAPGTSRDLLIDTGATNAVRFLTKPFLRAQGVNRLPALLLTHGDIQHVGGTQLLLGAFKEHQILASPLRFRSPVYRRLLTSLSEVPGRLRTISRGGHVGDWTVLHPEARDRVGRADDGSVVLLGSIAGTRILLLSDLGRAGQNVLLKRGGDLRADILITGLPTSSEAVCDGLLEAVQPRLILISDSEFPASERASHALRERLGQKGIPVIYTRFSGAAIIEFRGRNWKLRTMSGEPKTKGTDATKRDEALYQPKPNSFRFCSHETSTGRFTSLVFSSSCSSAPLVSGSATCAPSTALRCIPSMISAPRAACSKLHGCALLSSNQSAMSWI